MVKDTHPFYFSPSVSLADPSLRPAGSALWRHDLPGGGPEPQGPSAGDLPSTARRRTDKAKDTSEKGSFSRAGWSQPRAGEARPAFIPERTSSVSRTRHA